MEQILERIKERVAQRDSPVKTVKGLIEVIGMSEAGFYTMLKRGTTKQGTLLAIADALKVEPSFLKGNLDSESSQTKFGEEVLQKIMVDIHEMRQEFVEQLRVKDQQIAGMQKMLETSQRMLEAVLGKLEGVTDDQRSRTLNVFRLTSNQYAFETFLKLGETFINVMTPVKLFVNTHHQIGNVGGTHSHQLGEMVSID